jgi:hypothetical protein
MRKGRRPPLLAVLTGVLASMGKWNLMSSCRPCRVSSQKRRGGADAIFVSGQLGGASIHPSVGQSEDQFETVSGRHTF